MPAEQENPVCDSVDAPFIPYGRQHIDEQDIEAVIEILRSDWLTTGPAVEQFESLLAKTTESSHAVAVANGTAALHAAMYAINIQPGDEVIVPPITFAATANAVVFQGGTPVFADVSPDCLLIDPTAIESRITGKTKAIIAVDYAGHPCDYDALRQLADRHGLILVSDSCHSLGGKYKNRPAGSLADLNTFSFHPVKNITTGEGGAVTTNHREWAERMRSFRNHCISTDHHQRSREGNWFYQITDLGYNYRITDLQCALGIQQLGKLEKWIERRQEIAALYKQLLADFPFAEPLPVLPDVSHAFHLFVIRLAEQAGSRAEVFSAMRQSRIGVNVHYIPVHLHPFYKSRFGTAKGMCPVAESAYERIMSLPVFPTMSDADVERVVTSLRDACNPEKRRL